MAIVRAQDFAVYRGHGYAVAPLQENRKPSGESRDKCKDSIDLSDLQGQATSTDSLIRCGSRVGSEAIVDHVTSRG